MKFFIGSLGNLPPNCWLQSNISITNLDGLSNLISVTGDGYSGVTIDQNEDLTDLCGIQNLVVSNVFQGAYTVEFNAYNPYIQDFIDGNCRQ
jgi:hypothetical protein